MNRITLSGRAGQDPKVYDYGERKFARFTMATTERGYKTKDGKEVEPETTWHNISVNQTGLAGVVEKYIKKGMQVLVSGKLLNRKYTDKDGNERSVTEVVVDELEMLSRKEDDRQPEEKETITPLQDDLPF